MSTLLHVIPDRAPALATLAQECKGCPGTLCKGCHGTEHASGCPAQPIRSRQSPTPETRLPCGKVCGCEGPALESIGTDRLMGMSQRCLKVPKAMFLSWLTLA